MTEQKVDPLSGAKKLEAAAYYRQRAAQVRAEADEVKLGGIRTQFLVIATHYEELAEMIEKPRVTSGR